MSLKMPRCRAALLVTGSVLLGLPASYLFAADAGGIPRGVFSLARESEPADPAVLRDADVDGISIRQPWRELEKSPGVFDWSYLDSEVRRAADADKVVLLRILSEGPGTHRGFLRKACKLFPTKTRTVSRRAVPVGLQCIGILPI